MSVFLKTMSLGKALTTSQRIALSINFPLMNKVPPEILDLDGGVNPLWRPLLDELHERCIVVTAGPEDTENFIAPLREVSPEHEFRHGSWFPGLSKARDLNSYSHPTRAQSNECCSKRGSRTPSLNPGIFTIQCTHSVCFGFELLSQVESPKTLFDIIMSKFHRCPRIIIYDNACNFVLYAMKREPSFFKNMLPFIDRLHCPSHINCSGGFNLNNFPFLKAINSQAAEVDNMLLNLIKKPASFMTQLNFMRFTRMFICELNKRKNTAINSQFRTNHIYRDAPMQFRDGVKRINQFMLT